MENRKCLVCGNIFKPGSSNQKYCGKNCYNVKHNKNQYIKIGKCRICGKEFKSKRSNQEYCGSKCRNIYWGKLGYKKNREHILLKIKNDQEYKKKQREYRQTERFKKTRNKRLRIRRITDPVYRLKSLIWGRIRIDSSINKKSKIQNIESYLGYKIGDLWDYLKGTISIGFSEEDYLNGLLELDHIIPYSWYIISYPGDAEFKKCWSWNNLRLIPKDVNRNRRRLNFDWNFIKENKLYDILPLGPRDIYNMIIL
jgi:hypothetical protein